MRCEGYNAIRESGGTGRRARLRGVWIYRTGSSPVSRTIKALVIEANAFYFRLGNCKKGCKKRKGMI